MEGAAYFSMGVLYDNMGQFLKAMDCYKKFLAVCQKLNDEVGQEVRDVVLRCCTVRKNKSHFLQPNYSFCKLHSQVYAQEVVTKWLPIQVKSSKYFHSWTLSAEIDYRKRKNFKDFSTALSSSG